MSPLERQEEAALVRHLNHLGLLHVKLNVQGSRGWLDRLIFIPGGYPLLIELKRPGLTHSQVKKKNPLQAYRKQQLLELGYDAQTHHTRTTAIQAVNQAVAAARVSAEGGQVAAKPARRRVVS